jgi:hypothetical protein
MKRTKLGTPTTGDLFSDFESIQPVHDHWKRKLFYNSYLPDYQKACEGFLKTDPVLSEALLSADDACEPLCVKCLTEGGFITITVYKATEQVAEGVFDVQAKQDWMKKDILWFAYHRGELKCYMAYMGSSIDIAPVSQQIADVILSMVISNDES